MMELDWQGTEYGWYSVAVVGRIDSSFDRRLVAAECERNWRHYQVARS